MKKIIYLFKLKITKYILRKDTNDLRIEYFRSKGVSIGKNVRAFSDVISAEPYLLKVGDDCTISTGVKFTTHDNSITKVCSDRTDIFGEIVIGNNCFIGQNTIILPGCKIQDNTIIGAGSVVTKSFYESNIIIAGNPAKKIGNWDNFKEKFYNKSLNTRYLNFENKKEMIFKNEDKLVTK